MLAPFVYECAACDARFSMLVPEPAPLALPGTSDSCVRGYYINRRILHSFTNKN
jgi:hypothetical protein